MMITLNQLGNVPANLLANANFTIAIVNEIFRTFPNRFRFTSGYRTAAQNAAVSGVRDSYHVTAEAADFVPIDGRYPAGELEAIGALVSRFGYEVIKHNSGSGLHYHIEPTPSGKIMPDPGTYDPAVPLASVSEISQIARMVAFGLLAVLVIDLILE